MKARQTNWEKIPWPRSVDGQDAGEEVGNTGAAGGVFVALAVLGLGYAVADGSGGCCGSVAVAGTDVVAVGRDVNRSQTSGRTRKVVYRARTKRHACVSDDPCEERRRRCS